MVNHGRPWLAMVNHFDNGQPWSTMVNNGQDNDFIMVFDG